MFKGYDHAAAKESLLKWTSTRINAEFSKPNICKLLHDTSDINSICGGTPTAWRLVTNPREPEEVVFKIQGVIVFSELPPFTKQLGKKASAAVLRQGITLTGFGSQAFEDGINGIKIADLLLRRNVPQLDSTPLSCTDELDGHQALHLSNRYFLSRRLANGETSVDLDPVVDPYGILKKVGGTDFVHTAENIVEYEKVKKADDKEIIFESISPAVFRVGDVVEAQFTLMMVPTGRNGKPPYKSFATLRSITLLDDTYSKKYEIEKIVVSRSNTTLKRSAGNWQETEELTTKQMRGMDIGGRA
ncbi:hypothetical protein VNI00_013372 [Paramarasmius palmivorus]|uniref:Uncharacterized protein n=1 Tax=Paramarasmius palmivorus TaxID=297713 RepID=A0AAW0BZV3_9AGAR